jgi:SP family myo-inositol transporter-like MFS transporter 13
MSSREEADQAGPNAPLLTPTDHDHDHDGDLSPDPADNVDLAPELEYAGGWFIWILTISAGISGLLFGYE